jgi:hypothetical protein
MASVYQIVLKIDIVQTIAKRSVGHDVVQFSAIFAKQFYNFEHFFTWLVMERSDEIWEADEETAKYLFESSTFDRNCPGFVWVIVLMIFGPTILSFAAQPVPLRHKTLQSTLL